MSEQRDRMKVLTDQMSAYLEGAQKEKPWVFRTNEIVKTIADLFEYLRLVDAWDDPTPICPERAKDAPGQQVIPGTEEPETDGD